MSLENWRDIPFKRNPQLILFGVVGFDSLDLDDDCSIALREGFTLGGDSAGDVHEVSPSAMAMAVAMDMIRYLMAFLRRCF